MKKLNLKKTPSLKINQTTVSMKKAIVPDLTTKAKKKNMKANWRHMK